jgi:hypothetical protein
MFVCVCVLCVCYLPRHTLCPQTVGTEHRGEGQPNVHLVAWEQVTQMVRLWFDGITHESRKMSANEHCIGYKVGVIDTSRFTH